MSSSSSLNTAFLAEPPRDVERDDSPLVHVLCWARLNNAWASAVEAWRGLAGYRAHEPTSTAPSQGLVQAPDWVVSAAPRLSLPFRDLLVAESTLAAFVQRISITFAVAIVSRANSPEGRGASDYPSSLHTLMTDHAAYLRSTRGRPLTTICALSQNLDANRALMEAFSLVRIPESPWAATKLRFAPLSDEPLPFEIAGLVGASIRRKLSHPHEPNPIVDAVLAKLFVVPRQLAVDRQKKRR